MPRSRLLKPGFFANEELATLPFEARLCFAGLWTLADRAGRLEDRPKRIDGALFPYDSIAIDAVLGALAAKGFIRRYVADGRAVIDIPTFLEHQAPHPREVPSQLPAYQEVGQAAARVEPLHDSGSTFTRPGPSVSVSVSVSDPVSVSVCPEAAAPPRHTRDPIFARNGHQSHAACGRVCVPAFLHDEFRRALGGNEVIADTRLRDWYLGVMQALPDDGAVDPDGPKFWRPRFQGAFLKPGGVAATYAPSAEWVCLDDPPCEAGTSPFRCHQRHELLLAKSGAAV